MSNINHDKNLPLALNYLDVLTAVAVSVPPSGLRWSPDASPYLTKPFSAKSLIEPLKRASDEPI